MLRSLSASLLVICAVASIAGAQLSIVNTATPLIGYTDISATGTALLGAGDDTDHGFTTTVGNSLFPAGPCVMGSNGTAIASTLPTGFSYYYNEGTPIVPGLDASVALGYGVNSQAVCAFWDDLYGANFPNTSLYWKELPGVLIMQWNAIEKFYPSSPGANGFATFQIQVFQGAPCQPETIQILYPDATFGLGGAAFDWGAGATIGYISGAAGNLQWSHLTPSVPDGTCLTITKLPPFGVAYTSPFGAGSVQVNLCAGPPNGGFFLAVTLNAGTFPNGWLYGIDISYNEIVNELTTGYPFLGGLDAAGAAQIGPFNSLPSGLVLYSVGFAGPAGPIPSIHSLPTGYAIP